MSIESTKTLLVMSQREITSSPAFICLSLSGSTLNSLSCVAEVIILLMANTIRLLPWLHGPVRVLVCARCRRFSSAQGSCHCKLWCTLSSLCNSSCWLDQAGSTQLSMRVSELWVHLTCSHFCCSSCYVALWEHPTTPGRFWWSSKPVV